MTENIHQSSPRLIELINEYRRVVGIIIISLMLGISMAATMITGPLGTQKVSAHCDGVNGGTENDKDPDPPSIIDPIHDFCREMYADEAIEKFQKTRQKCLERRPDLSAEQCKKIAENYAFDWWGYMTCKCVANQKGVSSDGCLEPENPFPDIPEVQDDDTEGVNPPMGDTTS